MDENKDTNNTDNTDNLLAPLFPSGERIVWTDSNDARLEGLLVATKKYWRRRHLFKDYFQYKSASSGLSMPSLFPHDVGSPRARCGHRFSIPPRRTFSRLHPPPRDLYRARGERLLVGRRTELAPGLEPVAKVASGVRTWSAPRVGHCRAPCGRANDAVAAPSPASRENLSAGWKQV